MLGLRNASASTAQWSECCHGDHGGAGEGGIRRSGEVGMKFVQVQIVGAEVHHVVRRTSRRCGRAIEIGWKQSADRGALLEADLGGRLSRQHGAAVVGAGVGADEGVPVEHVESFVVSVGPHAHLRIVIEVGVLERVAIKGSSSVGSCRDRDALQVRRGGDGELAEDPALRDFVVEDDRIAVIIGLASTAKAGPERIAGGWPSDFGASRLIEDGERSVDPLHVLRRSLRSRWCREERR